MALALLDLVGLDRERARFKIDTGTNGFYQLKAGRSIQTKSGIDWVSDVFLTTALVKNPSGGELLGAPQEISIPLSRLDRGNVYVQLFSFKNGQGKSPGFSSPALLPIGAGGAGSFLPLRNAAMMMSIDEFRLPRKVPCRMYREVYSQQASIEDLLSVILKAAGPLVAGLLAGQNGTQNAQGRTQAQGSAPSNSELTSVLVSLLKTVLGGLPGGMAQPAAIAQSLQLGDDPNRFFNDNGKNGAYSRPFIFGVDDALIGALAGPILQVLPQLMNAANQKRLQMKQADNKLITDILSDTNRRLLVEQLLQLRQKSAPSAQSPDLTQLLQLLQQAQGSQTAASSAAPAAAPLPAAQSFSLDPAQSATISSRAVVTFVTLDPIPWNGKPEPIFRKDQPVNLKLRLAIADPAPKSPLDKAILKIVFKDASDQMVHFEKTFKQKGVVANTDLSFAFTPNELAKVPSNRPIAVLAELRWLTPANERKALGSMELVFVNKYFVKEQGAAVTSEKELTDMKLFRPFWNKVWESPVLDAANNRGDSQKYLWELDVNGKYSVLLTDQPSNGLMQTKLLRGPGDPDSLSERIDGRMKAGIELSMVELNKLCPLWDAQPLESDQLNALATPAVAQNNATEFIYHYKLKGKAAERGMIWVIPTFQLFEFTLNTTQSFDQSGQVTAVAEERVRFPLPVAARVIGLKSLK